MMGSERSAASASDLTPPPLAAIIGGLVLAPILIGATLWLLQQELGLGFLLVGTPACLLAIPVVIVLRRKLAFRLRNALVVGFVMAFAIGATMELSSGRNGYGSVWSLPFFFGALGAVYSVVAYGLIKIIDAARKRASS